MEEEYSESVTGVESDIYHDQISNIDNLIEEVQKIKKRSLNMSIILWYLSHIIAFIGWGSGLSIVGLTVGEPNIDATINIILGICSTIYPLCKYLKLEETKKDYDILSLFCIDIEDKLRKTEISIKQIVSDGYDPKTEKEEYNRLIRSLTDIKKVILMISTMGNDLEKILEDFEKRELGSRQFEAKELELKI